MAQRASKCMTKNLMLLGADRAGIVCDQSFDIITITLREDYGFDRDIAEHLTRNYGTRALSIAQLVRAGYESRKADQHPKRLVSKYPFLEAEVVFCVREEYCLTAVDFLARRCRMAFLDHSAALEALPHVVDMMGKLLQWSKKKKKEELERGLDFLDTMHVIMDDDSDAHE
jgi:glycerol-3-phosphate dehydrogenase